MANLTDLRGRTERALGTGKTVAQIRTCLTAFFTRWHGLIDPQSPMLPIIKGMDGVVDARAALMALPEDSLPILLRLAQMDLRQVGPLAARRTVDRDARAYLASTMLTAWGLLIAVTAPEDEALMSLRGILLDAEANDDQRVGRILALHARAADLCSYHYADGPDPSDIGRFYASRSSFSADAKWTIVDRRTNLVVRHHGSARIAEALAATMSAFPEVGHQMALMAECRRMDVRPSPDESRHYQGEESRLDESLRRASRSWREAGNLRYDPWNSTASQ